LILLPLSQPPNSLLTAPPPPLSAAMPAHSTHPAGGNRTTEASSETGLTDKIKNLFHRGSTSTQHTSSSHAQTQSQDSEITAVEGGTERVLDQTAMGEQLPSARANAVGATNVDANAETGWPGLIAGDKLGEVVVDLRGVEKGKVDLGGGKKSEGSYVVVPVSLRSNARRRLMKAGGIDYRSFLEHDTRND
jgi:hypothetical protein